MGSVLIAGRSIYYHAAGELAGRGRRVLCVHGTGCNGAVWAPPSPSPTVTRA